eukprot:6196151-Pleurochrysis_carterae.AAC.1
MVLVRKTVNIDWSPARAWVAPMAETAASTVSANGDTGIISDQNAFPRTEWHPNLRAAAFPPRRHSNPSNHRQIDVYLPNFAAARPAHQSSKPQLPSPLPSESKGRPGYALQRCTKGWEHVPSSVATRPQFIMRIFRCAKQQRALCPHAHRTAALSSLYRCSTTA